MTEKYAGFSFSEGEEAGWRLMWWIDHLSNLKRTSELGGGAVRSARAFVLFCKTCEIEGRGGRRKEGEEGGGTVCVCSLLG